MRELERRYPTPSFYPAGHGAADALAWWAEKTTFLPAVSIAFAKRPDALPEGFLEDRAHQPLVAQRICRYADIVGRERVLAGADCGFGTSANATPMVAPSVVWAKLKSLAEGAEIATQRLWG